jgi:hypothetical protein
MGYMCVFLCNYDTYPLHGLFEARQDGGCFKIVIDPPRGSPVGGGGVHHNGIRYYDFYRSRSDSDSSLF